MIPGKPLAMVSVFNGFFWAAADTCHTVGTAAPPGGLPVLQADVVQRTVVYTDSAGDAAVCGVKFVCVDEKWIKQTVYDSAADLISYREPGCRKGQIFCDNADCVLDLVF